MKIKINFFLKNKISIKVFNTFINILFDPVTSKRIKWLAKEYKNIRNWFDLLLILLNIKKKTDVVFKNGFKFQELSKNYWRYLYFYIKAFKNNVIIKNLGTKIIVQIWGLNLQLIDNINGIYQINEIFIDENYNKFDYKNKIIIDIGGFIGDTALYFISEGAKKVYVYEINREVFEILKSNIKMNNLEEKIIPFNIGVSNNYKEGILNITEIKGSTSLYHEFNEKMNIMEKQKINLVPFKDILKESIDILKIDCEGCEYEILENILENSLLEKIKEGIILEYHNIDKNRNSEYAKKLLADIGFDKIYCEIKSNFLGLIYAKR